MRAVIQRLPDNKIETQGKFIVYKGFDVAFECDSLELADKGNQHNISCIPKGKYLCKWAYMNNMKAYHYQITNVPDRDKIFIHNGNYANIEVKSDIRGCVLLGSGYSDINADGQLDILNSRNTLSQFESLMDKQDFELEII